MKRLKLIGPVVVLVAMPTFAATTSVNSSINALAVQLVDLAPHDDVAPSLTFVEGTYTSAISATGWGLGNHEFSFASSAVPWSSIEKSIVMGLTQGTAAIAGAGAVDGTTLRTFGGSATSLERYRFTGGLDVFFVLSANTELRVFAPASIGVILSGGQLPDDLPVNAMAAAWMSITDGSIHDGDIVVASDSLKIDLGNGGCPLPCVSKPLEFTSSKDMAMVLSNTSAVANQYGFQSGVAVQVIPEPGSSLLMLAGLLVVGTLAGRPMRLTRKTDPA